MNEEPIYYLFTIQYNKDADAENRPQPRAFKTFNEAVAAFHKQVGADMTNATLGWSINMIIDNNCFVHKSEKWSL